MKVVFISDNGCHHKKITINIWLLIFLPVFLSVAGFLVASYYSNSTLLQVLSSDHDIKAGEAFSQVLNKLSMLDAEVQRLNALASHI